jgi:endonuclease YncB( thermonuclease family)
MRSVTFIILSLILASASIGRAEKEIKYYRVADVISGDSLKLDTGTVITYSSLKAPDMKANEQRIIDYAKESRDYHEQLMRGQEIYVEWGAKIRNDDGIYQPYVFLKDGTFVNQKLLESGYVKLDIVPPNLEHNEELQKAARDARQNGMGLWVHESEEDRRVAVIGNVHTKKFYFPDDPVVEDIPRPDQEKFSSVVRATEAGYTPSWEYRQRYGQETSLY